MSQELVVSALQRAMSGLLSEEDEVVDSGNGDGKTDGGVEKPFLNEAERAYLVANTLCWHCVTPGFRKDGWVSHYASTDYWPPSKPFLLIAERLHNSTV